MSHLRAQQTRGRQGHFVTRAHISPQSEVTRAIIRDASPQTGARKRRVPSAPRARVEFSSLSLSLVRCAHLASFVFSLYECVVSSWSLISMPLCFISTRSSLSENDLWRPATLNRTRDLVCARSSRERHWV